MEIMKNSLALLAAAFGVAVCHAQALTAGQPASNLRQVAVQKSLPAPSSMPRQLSAEERAELRRQLSQYSRVAGKGS
jgi:hypothetical protein